jgi:hypothetical protein
VSFESSVWQLDSNLLNIGSDFMQNKPLKLSGVVAVFEPKVAASEAVSGFDLIKLAYDDAIEYRGIAIGSRGIASTFGLLNAAAMSWVIHDLYLIRDNKDGIMYVINLLFISIFAAFGIYLLLKTIRMDLFNIEDEPVIFDRRSRKVYRIYRHVAPGSKGLFSKWPVKFSEYSWDFLSAEHHAAVSANHASVSRIHRLVFRNRQSVVDNVIAEGFSIGNSLSMGEVTVPVAWEHIRRFMEENGPSVPPGEMIRRLRVPSSLMDSVRSSVNLFLRFCRNQKFIAALLIVLFPVTLPGAISITFFSWLSYKTMIPIQWPKYVKDAVGEPLTIPAQLGDLVEVPSEQH